MHAESTSLLLPIQPEQLDNGSTPISRRGNEQLQQKSILKPPEAWRFTIAIGIFSATFILLVNIITLVVVSVKYRVEDKAIAFYTGKCQIASRMATLAQVIINIMSSILLAASNFSMQCLSSPTRKDIDLAHSKRTWLDIGAPSFRNLFFIPRSKAFIWLLLGSSSFPLHMIWNSVVFNTEAQNDWLMILVTEDFFHGANWSISNFGTAYVPFVNPAKPIQYEDSIRDIQRMAQHHDSLLQNLSLQSCYDIYESARNDTIALTDRSHALLVADLQTGTSNSSVLGVWTELFNTSLDVPLALLFSSNHTLAETKSKYFSPGNTSLLEQYQSFNPPLRSCYSQTRAEKCKTSIIPVFLIIVIISNTTKVLGFILTLRLTRDNPPLCTVGDAVQSFLNRPDLYTRGYCLAASRNYQSPRLRPPHPKWQTTTCHTGDIWMGGRKYWSTAIRKRQILSISIILFSILFAFGGWILHESSKTFKTPPHTFFSILTPDISRVVYWCVSKDSNFLWWIVLFNGPQILISYLYLGLNNIMTTMLVQAEWCSFSGESGRQPKGLRVSSPIVSTEQRSTYFLSLPYRWSIPAIIIITLVHWLVSEVFHIVQVDWNMNGGIYTFSNVALIISPAIVWYIVFPVLCGSYVLLLALALLMRYPGGMPLAGGCSASIAAACQPSRLQDTSGSEPSFPPGMACDKLQWGVVDDPDESPDGIGHATFSADHVKPLKEGALYN